MPPVNPLEFESRPSPAAYAALLKKLPDMWWGYMTVLAYWAAQLYLTLVVQQQGFTRETLPTPLPQAIELAKWPAMATVLGCATLYFCFVYVFHRIAAETPGWHHPISPMRAVGFHFIPLYSYYWLFKWPLEFGKYLRWCTPNPGIGWQLGLAYIGSQLLFLLDPGTAILATVGLLGYIRWRLRLALEFKATSVGEAYSQTTPA